MVKLEGMAFLVKHSVKSKAFGSFTLDLEPSVTWALELN